MTGGMSVLVSARDSFNRYVGSRPFGYSLYCFVALAAVESVKYGL